MKYQGILGAQYRGKLCGVVGSHNKGGDYFRKLTTPTNPNSSRQQTTRTLFGLYATNWSNLLTQAQRDAWETYAQSHTIKDSQGNDIYINGLCWYVMFNTRLSDAGAAAITDPPPASAPAGFYTFTVDISALNTADVTFTPACPALHRVQLWQTLPGSAGQTPNFNQARLVGYSGVAEASPWAATMPFGCTSGNQVTFYGAIMNQYGQVSPYEQHTDLSDY